MLTNQEIKLIQSLSKKKFRQKYNKFIVEGVKSIQEVLKSAIHVEKIYTTKDVYNRLDCPIEIISETELQKLSSLVHPNLSIALCEIPNENEILSNGVILALEDVRDPGNFGTIIRLCDWFGIEQIVCSYETVDLYNSKVLQASMGSFTRVRVNYIDLQEYLNRSDLSIYGTFMEGENVYQTKFPEDLILLMGNEANGISEKLLPFLSKKITIPQFGKSQDTESLNVAMSTGIILSEIVSKSFS